MALSEFQRADVDRRLGDFCKRRNRPGFPSQPRLGYRFTGSEVVLFESRPTYHRPNEWHEHDIAKFRYVANAHEWRLFCLHRDLKWHTYTPRPSAPDFDTLLQEVATDPTGIFWG